MNFESEGPSPAARAPGEGLQGRLGERAADKLRLSFSSVAKMKNLNKKPKRPSAAPGAEDGAVNLTRRE